jgi:hypothetical protein
VRSHTKHDNVQYVQHVTAFYLQLSLYQPNDRLFNPKHLAILEEEKSMLCFDQSYHVFITRREDISRVSYIKKRKYHEKKDENREHVKSHNFITYNYSTILC